MRRTAALVALWAIWSFRDARAESGPQLVLQAGAVGLVSGQLTHPAFTIDCIHSPFHLGAGWLEFGILQRNYDDLRDLYPAGYDPSPLAAFQQLATRQQIGIYSPQVLELSTGVIIGPTGHAFFPYLRAGFGVYHEEIISGADVPVPLVYFAPDGGLMRTQGTHFPSGQEDWGLGISLGVGGRFAIRNFPEPTVEARLHYTRLDGHSRNQLFTVTGGLWLR